MLSTGGNVAAAEAEFQRTGNFLSDNGKGFVSFAELSQKRKDEEIAQFRALTAGGNIPAPSGFDPVAEEARIAAELRGEVPSAAPAPAADVAPAAVPQGGHPSASLTPAQMTARAERTKRAAIAGRAADEELTQQRIAEERRLRRGRIGPLGLEP
jgi:hypothetical protein